MQSALDAIEKNLLNEPVAEDTQPRATSSPPRQQVRSTLEIGELEDKMLRSTGKKGFRDVYHKKTEHCVPYYESVPGWNSEYDEFYVRPDDQRYGRKCHKCNRPLSKRERSRTRKHFCGRSASKSKN